MARTVLVGWNFVDPSEPVSAVPWHSGTKRANIEQSDMLDAPDGSGAADAP
jgi:hypothetical protein